MKLSFQSDIHTEFDNRSGMYWPKFVNEDVLIIAGDVQVGLGENDVYWFGELLKDRNVVYILGNHELYHNDLTELTYITLPLWTAKVNEHAEQRGYKFKLHSLQNQTVKIGDVNFIGATLWTDFNKDSEFVKRLGPKLLNDFRYIRNGMRTASADDLLAEHKRSKKFITDQLKLLKGEKNVVITHHLPSYESVDVQYRVKPGDEIFARSAENKAMNHFFYSDLDSLVKKSTLWIHGHTHSSCDYKLGKARVICNPRGYFPSALNSNFVNGLIMEI